MEWIQIKIEPGLTVRLKSSQHRYSLNKRICNGQEAKCALSSTQSPKWHQLLPVKGFKLKSERASGYKVPGRDFFDTDDKVRFYTGLPSIEVLMKTFEHVT